VAAKPIDMLWQLQQLSNEVLQTDRRCAIGCALHLMRSRSDVLGCAPLVSLAELETGTQGNLEPSRSLVSPSFFPTRGPEPDCLVKMTVRPSKFAV
jgi:hypothetical protein